MPRLVQAYVEDIGYLFHTAAFAADRGRSERLLTATLSDLRRGTRASLLDPLLENNDLGSEVVLGNSSARPRLRVSLLCGIDTRLALTYSGMALHPASSPLLEFLSDHDRPPPPCTPRRRCAIHVNS
ncbi:hypothetical protein [Nocardia niwae]|uniref:hypothetical protein n=1 Tax=Nocardia niwae TaxID=626084 RepID=UPI00340B79CA